VGRGRVGNEPDLIHARVELVHQELGGILGVSDGLRWVAAGPSHRARTVQDQHHIQGPALHLGVAFATHHQVDVGSLTDVPELSRFLDGDVWQPLGLGKATQSEAIPAEQEPSQEQPSDECKQGYRQQRSYA